MLYAILAALILAWPRGLGFESAVSRMSRAWPRLAAPSRDSPVACPGRGAGPRGGVLAPVVLWSLSFWGQQYTGSVFVLSACYAIVTAGMAVQIGFSQQIAFCQSVFMGAGAYGVAC